jgi:hypothetical protein
MDAPFEIPEKSKKSPVSDLAGRRAAPMIAALSVAKPTGRACA